MKILINALGADMGGAIRHLTNFLPELGRTTQRFEYEVLIRSSAPDIPVASNIHLRRVPSSKTKSRLSRLMIDVAHLPYWLKRDDFGATVSLASGGPIWSPVPHVLYQRNSLYYCKHYLGSVTGRRKAEILLRRRLAIASMKRAELIVTPSNAMAQMIQDSCPQVRNRRFVTLRHGYDRASMKGPLETRFARRLGRASGTRLLYPTHPAAHKGFEVLFDALAILAGRGLDFTLISTIEYADWPQGIARYQKRITELGLQDRVVFLGRVPQQQMGAVYAACDLMVYPSLCESFGFSMIEAMAMGLPIVASGTAINREMCAQGALYYDPLDCENAADCIELALDSVASVRLKEGGKIRVEEFDWSWKRYANEFVNLVESVT